MSKNYNVELSILENQIISIFSEFSSIIENFNSMMKNEKSDFLNENDSSFKIVTNLIRVKDELHSYIDKIYKENNNKVLLYKTFEFEEMMYELENLKKKYNELKHFTLNR